MKRIAAIWMCVLIPLAGHAEEVLPGVRRFVSAVNTDEDLTRTVEALDGACRAIK